MKPFRTVFLYAVLANLPFWVASHFLGLMQGGVFNLEFLILGGLSFFLNRVFGLLLLLTAILVDIVTGICRTYMFSPSDLLHSVPSLPEVAPAHAMHLLWLALCMLMVCVAVLTDSPGEIGSVSRRHTMSALAGIAALGVIIDAGTGHILLLQPARQLGATRFIRLPTRNLFKLQLLISGIRKAGHPFAGASLLGASRFATASTQFHLKEQEEAPNIVLVLVESWGKPMDAQLDDLLVQPYASLLEQQYTLHRGTVPFLGGTVAAEARELCGSAEGLGIMQASTARFQECLPATLARLGYRSLAIHGFSGGMYDRQRWYPRVGFNEVWFRDQLRQQGLSQCQGVFPGICDTAVTRRIGDYLESSPNQPQFVYWVTLNSHLPVSIPNHVVAPPDCSSTAATGESSALCSWYQLIFNVHRSIAQLALRPATRPTIFVIVGDHAPPFSEPGLRSQFSDQTVPYVVLLPRRDAPVRQPPVSVAMLTHPPVSHAHPHRSGKESVYSMTIKSREPPQVN